MLYSRLALTVAASFVIGTRAGSECGLGGVVITNNNNNNTFLGIPAAFSGLRRNASEQLPLIVAEPPNACDPFGQDLSGVAVLLQRGNCTFSEKAANLQQAHAAVGLVANTDEDCMFMSLEKADLDPESQFMLVSIPRAAGKSLQQAAADGATVSVWLPHYSTFDFNAVLLWAIAVGTFALAGICAADDCKASAASSSLDDENTDSYQLDIQEITPAGAMAFVAVASASLLVLYFFLNNAFYWILMTMFSIGAFQALAACLSPACKWLAPHQRIQLLSIPHKWLPDSVFLYAILSNAIALATLVIWLAVRDRAWAWLLQDLLGICLIVLVLRQFRLPNLKVASILLPLCFVYDVFWVFLQPLLTNGESVMVRVATGGEEHWQLPMLIIIPAFHATPGVGPVMLGFGDILLPGLLGVYVRTYDVHNKLAARHSYFWPCVVGYAVGLLLTYIALYFSIGGDQGQPALLYLVPCTLGVVLILAHFRKQLPQMWRCVSTDAHNGDIEAHGDAETPLL